MISNENVKRIFRYDLEKDDKNCIVSTRHDPAFTSHQVTGGKSIVDLLSVSQPSSIFSKHTQSLNCFGARSTLLKRAIVLPNSYELFLSPWLADGSFSYPHKSIMQDWKRWFPSAHNAQLAPGSAMPSNAIGADAFDGIVCLLDQKPKYIIKNHDDANNYWHWTFEWLPRLFVLKEIATSNARLEKPTFLNIGSALNPFQQEWIWLLFGESIEVCNYSSPILCNNILWITPPFPAHHSHDTILKIRDHILGTEMYGVNRVRGEYPSRIYLLRGDARNGRRVANEPQIIDGLKRLGFVAMAMDGLSVIEQAQIFSGADIIVGAHGSAFVNMIFCKRSCKIIELFGSGYVSGHDYSLALSCGLHWEYLEGESTDIVPSFVSDFRIELDKLLIVLTKLLTSSMHL